MTTPPQRSWWSSISGLRCKTLNLGAAEVSDLRRPLCRVWNSYKVGAMWRSKLVYL
jgi:hypothetical protein